MNVLLYVLLGLVAGSLSGLIGIGGGVIIVPVLIYAFGLAQLEAQGTTLALMIPPIGLLAALTYYKLGYVNLTIALCICAGFFVGGLIGARLACALPASLLRKIFGVALLAISLYMIFGHHNNRTERNITKPEPTLRATESSSVNQNGVSPC